MMITSDLGSLWAFTASCKNLPPVNPGEYYMRTWEGGREREKERKKERGRERRSQIPLFLEVVEPFRS